MQIIGPFSCHLNGTETWLQITIGEDGKCSEIKQASAEDMAKNSWHTLKQEEWPTLIPIYDPTTSQKHFILKREENHVINRHTIHEAKGVQPPTFRVTRQTYTSTHMTAPSIISGETAQQLVAAFWVPESGLQTQLDAELHAWKQAQTIAIWHHDESESNNDMSNLPLDFQKNQDGTDKASITDTDLNATQQWRIKSVLYENLALLKAESSSSEEYCAALRYLIDGKESATIFSEKTRSNIDDISKMIDPTGINRYLKSDFYTKPSPNQKTSTVALEENDPGYQATIGSVVFYIQHLLAAEIQQYFPQHPRPIIAKLSTLSSVLPVGKLPTDHHESTVGLSQAEISDIDLIYRLMTTEASFNSMSDEDWAHVAYITNSIQNRLAETSSIADTLHLLFTNENDYEEKLRSISTKIDAHKISKSIRDLINNEEEMINALPLITNKNEKLIYYAINQLNPNERLIVLHALFQHEEKFDRRTMMPIDWVRKFDQQSQTELVQKIVSNLTEDELNYYTQLSSLIMLDPDHVSQTDKMMSEEALNAVFPIHQQDKDTRVARLLRIQHDFYSINNLERIHNALIGDVLIQNIKNCFENSNITDKKTALAALLPNLEKNGMWRGADILNHTLRGLVPEQQIEVLVSLFNYQNVNAHVTELILANENEGALSFTVLFDVMNQLPEKDMKSLLGGSTVLYTLRNLFSRYESEFQRKPLTFLSELSEEMLDKLAPKISSQEIQKHFDRYYNGGTQVEKYHPANTTHWVQTIDAIIEPFLHVGYNKNALDKLRATQSPAEAKAWLLLQVVEGHVYSTEYIVALGFQRLAEHQAALNQQVIRAEKRLQTQCESCGNLGKCLALELELLEQKQCIDKLTEIKAAMQSLPETLTETELRDVLIDPTNDLYKALAIPALPLRNDSFKIRFREKTKQPMPQPDFAILLEIKNCLDGRKQQFR